VADGHNDARAGQNLKTERQAESLQTAVADKDTGACTAELKESNFQEPSVVENVYEQAPSEQQTDHTCGQKPARGMCWQYQTV
jgi:hypothetical protein